MSRRTAEDQLRKLHGLPPYDGPSNYLRADGYFAASIDKEFPKEEIRRAKERLGIS